MSPGLKIPEEQSYIMHSIKEFPEIISSLKNIADAIAEQTAAIEDLTELIENKK